MGGDAPAYSAAAEDVDRASDVLLYGGVNQLNRMLGIFERASCAHVHASVGAHVGGCVRAIIRGYGTQIRARLCRQEDTTTTTQTAFWVKRNHPSYRN